MTCRSPDSGGEARTSENWGLSSWQVLAIWDFRCPCSSSLSLRKSWLHLGETMVLWSCLKDAWCCRLGFHLLTQDLWAHQGTGQVTSPTMEGMTLGVNKGKREQQPWLLNSWSAGLEGRARGWKGAGRRVRGDLREESWRALGQRVALTWL